MKWPGYGGRQGVWDPHPLGSAAAIGMVQAAADRVAELAREAFELALYDVAGEDDEHLAAIRQFFLQPQESYSFEELAALWRVPAEDVGLIYHDHIAKAPRGSEPTDADMPTVRIQHEDAVGAAVAFSLLRPFDVERALSGEFARIRSERWRTVPVLLRLPRFIADALDQHAFIPASQPALARRIEAHLQELFTAEQWTKAVVRDDEPQP